MSNLPVSIFCPFCQKQSYLTVAPSVCSACRRLVAKAVWEKDGNHIWWIGICGACKNPLLVLNEGQLVYPQSIPPPSD